MIFKLPPPKPALESALRRTFSELGVPEQEWEDRGLDIHNTPARVAKMYRDELLSSYRPGALDELKRRFTCFDSDGQDSLVVMANISFTSLCAHHMLPFEGVAHVGYLPGRKLIGASKLARVVEHYSRMLQIQERLARQVAEFIHGQAEARLVICVLEAEHHCMRMRGVKQQTSRMVTTAITPDPTAADRGLINEFYEQIKLLRGNKA